MPFNTDSADSKTKVERRSKSTEQTENSIRIKALFETHEDSHEDETEKQLGAIELEAEERGRRTNKLPQAKAKPEPVNYLSQRNCKKHRKMVKHYATFVN